MKVVITKRAEKDLEKLDAFTCKRIYYRTFRIGNFLNLEGI
ncbi:hypothetical protein FA11_1220 [Pelosinus fermentans A11]|uniref:Uncharacterized protein n=1 Tax=Pelosinus fermentans B4 TaxID=1149862 RepID=I9B725_9FIRM|nr:hypothetical protein FB4_1784 [Pelosinus fermentans B4]EIW27201.1 hypothetical protein FA11_1220 [Pelosinus fermentans A11]